MDEQALADNENEDEDGVSLWFFFFFSFFILYKHCRYTILNRLVY